MLQAFLNWYNGLTDSLWGALLLGIYAAFVVLQVLIAVGAL